MNTNKQIVSGGAWRSWPVAMGCILAILVSLLVPVGGPITNRWAAAAWNLLHVPGFFLLTRSLLVVFGGVPDLARRLFYAAVVATLASAGSELLQLRVGRSGSLEDFVLNGFGIALGILWPGRSDARPRSRKTICGLLLLAGIAFAFVPALLLGGAERRWSEKLPVIGDFKDEDCLRLWRAQGRAEAQVDPENGGLRVQLRPGTFGGVNFLPGEQDWSPYAELKLTVSNPGPPLHLGVRIDDRLSAKDRAWLSSEAWVGEGRSEIVLPLTSVAAPGGRRAIDLSRTTRLVLFVAEVENPVEFSILSAVLR